MAFEPLIVQHADAAITTATTFDLECFSDATFSGAPLTYPAQLTRGNEVFCRVRAQTSNERMHLVVPDCTLSASPTGFPKLEFHSDK